MPPSGRGLSRLPPSDRGLRLLAKSIGATSELSRLKKKWSDSTTHVARSTQIHSTHAFGGTSVHIRSFCCNLSRLSLICCRPCSRRWNLNRQITTSPGQCSNDSKCARSFNLPPVYCWRYALTALVLGVVLGKMMMIWFDADGWLRVGSSLFPLPFPLYRTVAFCCRQNQTMMTTTSKTQARRGKSKCSSRWRACLLLLRSLWSFPVARHAPVSSRLLFGFFWTSVCFYRYLSIFVDILVQAEWNIGICWWNYRYFMILSINNDISPMLSIFIANSFLVYRYL